MARRSRTRDEDDREPQQSGQPAGPPFYIARQPLPYGGEGAMPVNAYGPGDHVPAADVLAYGWQELVDVPEGDWPQPAELIPEDQGSAGPETGQEQAAGSGQDGE